MPRIPDVQPQVSIASAPSVRQSSQASAAAFGGQTAQAFQQAGQVGQSIALDIQKQQDALAVQQSFLGAQRELQQFLHDPESGIFSKKGSNAPGVYGETANMLPQIADRYSQNLSGKQRLLFDRFWRQVSEPSLNSVLTHEGKQFGLERNMTQAALVETNLEGMRLNFGDAKMLENSAEIIKATIRANGANNGSPEIYTNAKIKEAMSKGYSGAFEGFYAAGEYELAKTFLKDHEKDIDSDTHQRLSARLAKKTEEAFVLTEADIIWGKFGADGDDALPNSMEYIKNKYKGERRAAMEHRVKTIESDRYRLEQKKNNAEVNSLTVQMFDAETQSQKDAVYASASNDKTKASIARLYAQMSSTGPENERHLTDEQKQLNRKNAALNNIRAEKTVQEAIDRNPTFYAGDKEAVVALLMDTGITDKKTYNSLRDYAAGNGKYGEIPKSRVWRILKDKYGAKQYSTIENVTPELYNMVIDAATDSNKTLSDDDIGKLVYQSKLKAATDKSATFFTANKTWDAVLASGKPQTDFQAIDVLPKETVNTTANVMNWLNLQATGPTKELVTNDSVNRVLVSLMPNADNFIDTTPGSEASRSRIGGFLAYLSTTREIKISGQAPQKINAQTLGTTQTKDGKTVSYPVIDLAWRTYAQSVGLTRK